MVFLLLRQDVEHRQRAAETAPDEENFVGADYRGPSAMTFREHSMSDHLPNISDH